MNNDILDTSFTFGIFLVIVGLVGHFFGWDRANVIFLMGVAFELLALGIFLYRKFKK